MKKLVLKQDQIAENKYQYLVVQVVNATTPKVDKRLTEAEAKRLCDNGSWNVTIK